MFVDWVRNQNRTVVVVCFCSVMPWASAGVTQRAGGLYLGASSLTCLSWDVTSGLWTKYPYVAASVAWASPSIWVLRRSIPKASIQEREFQENQAEAGGLL